MEGQGASFIPKNSARVQTRARGTHRIYVLSYISYIVFFGTLFAVAGVYLYGSSVNRSLETLKSQLVTERSRFSEEDIFSIKLLDKRLDSAAQLVDESAAPSRIFADIEAVVASNIQFSGLKYTYLPNNQFSLALTGRTNELNDILWQRELLQGSNILKDAKVSKYDYSVAGEEGNPAAGDATLTFILTDTRPTSLIPYEAPLAQSVEQFSTSTASSTVIEENL